MGRRLGVMGGTFDPIHHGHLASASEVAARLALDEVVFVPAGQPWQKAGTDVSDAEDRYAMTLLATADDPRFTVSRMEIDRAGPTYTVDTLRALRAARPDDELFFVTGADVVGQIAGWREPAELFALATIVVVTRPGYAMPSAGIPGEVTVVDVPALTISSSACRERVRAGAPIRYLVPDAVARYIANRSLYAREAAAC